MNCGTPHRLGSPKIRSKGRGQVWNALRQNLGLPSKGIYDLFVSLFLASFSRYASKTFPPCKGRTMILRLENSLSSSYDE